MTEMTHYDDLAGIRWSRLSLMRRSPRAYHVAQRRETDALRRGSLVHAMALEPDEVSARYVVWDGGARRGKEWDAFSADHADVEIVTRAAWLDAERLAKSVRRIAGHILDACQRELAIQWEHASGLPLKAKLDAWHREGGRIFDVKILRDIEMRALGGAVYRYGYHAQMAHYADGVRAVFGSDCSASLIVVEADSLDGGIVDITDTDLRAGLDLRDELLARVVECERSGEWPGLIPERVPVMLPVWAYSTAEIELEEK